MTDQTKDAVPNVSSARSGGRRRRANVEGGRRYKHEVWASEEEEAMLLLRSQSAGVTIPRYLMETASARSAGVNASDFRDALAALFVTQRLLSSISNNTNQIARSANTGNLVNAEALATLDAVTRVTADVETCLKRIGKLL